MKWRPFGYPTAWVNHSHHPPEELGCRRDARSDRAILLISDFDTTALTRLSTIIAKPLAQRLGGAGEPANPEAGVALDSLRNTGGTNHNDLSMLTEHRGFGP